MEIINRVALVVTPKRRLMEWVNRLPDSEPELRPEDLVHHRTVVLVAWAAEPADVQEIVDEYWPQLFDEALLLWCTDESLWPANRTPHVFRDWFHVECIDWISDADPDEPFTVREHARLRCAICEAALDADAIAVILEAGSVTRLSVHALEERTAEEREEPRQRVVLRCCTPACAEEAERALNRALAETS